jgi:Fic family protein
MACFEDRYWEPTYSGPARADRRSGPYHAYVPDLLQSRPLIVDERLSAKAAQVEAGIRALTVGPEYDSLEGLARFLLRSEAIASSRIEGLQASPQQVALAELSQTERLSRASFSHNAQLVANNITVLRQAATGLAEAGAVDVAGIDALHRALLPDERHHGLRTIQNWIGGGPWNPLGAEYVPPAPERVGPLMADLVSYLNGGAHAPLFQAALAHAQFETNLPYTDVNGRVGRALIHTVLTRRGLTPAAVLPVSLVLLTDSNSYVRGLNAFRYTGAAHEEGASRATAEWLDIFLEAAGQAAQQVTRFAGQLAQLRTDWSAQLADRRGAGGKKEAPRADSAVARLLRVLPEIPMLTTVTVQRVLQVSQGAAYRAVEELTQAQILYRRTLPAGVVGYSAPDVFELLTFAERRMAGTRWDTRESPPARPVPAGPQR